MKNKFFYLFFILFNFLVSTSLLAHEEIIQNMVTHSPYLQNMTVKSFGNLQSIRHNALTDSFFYGQIKAEDVYGIGMPKGLAGELFIEAGKLYEGKFEQHRPIVQDQEYEISFLVYANIQNWLSITLPEEVVSFKQLEEILPILAAQAGLDSNAPFPFILQAKVKALQWFIVNGMGDGQPNYLTSFLNARYLGHLEDIDIQGIGFYSNQHQGIISAPNSQMHIHFMTLNAPLFIGHIDNHMVLTQGAKVFFPSP